MLRQSQRENPSRPLWLLRAEMAVEMPFLHRAAEALDVKSMFYAGTAHGDQEMHLELADAIQCAAICAPGILKEEKTSG